MKHWNRLPREVVESPSLEGGCPEDVSRLFHGAQRCPGLVRALQEGDVAEGWQEGAVSCSGGAPHPVQGRGGHPGENPQARPPRGPSHFPLGSDRWSCGANGHQRQQDGAVLARSSAGRRQALLEQRCPGTGTPLPILAVGGRAVSLLHGQGPPVPGGMGQANCCCGSREALTEAQPVLSADVRLTRGRKRSERRLLLLQEELVIAKLLHGTSLRPQLRLALDQLWVLSSGMEAAAEQDKQEEDEGDSTASLILAWPTGSCVATFGDRALKELWVGTLLGTPEGAKRARVTRLPSLQLLEKELSRRRAWRTQLSARSLERLLEGQAEADAKQGPPPVASGQGGGRCRSAAGEFGQERKASSWQRRSRAAFSLECGHAGWAAQGRRSAGGARSPAGQRPLDGVVRGQAASAAAAAAAAHSLEEGRARAGPGCPAGTPALRSRAGCGSAGPQGALHGGALALFSFAAGGSSSSRSRLWRWGLPWPFALRRSPAAAQAPGQAGSGCSRRLFGQPLAALCGEDATLPQPIQELLAVLQREGPATEGIFRRAASGTALGQLRQALDRGAEVELGSQPALLLAVLLKDFLRSIPDKLLGNHLYQEWMATLQKSSREEKVQELKAVAHKLPAANLLLLKRLLCLLRHIGHQAATSRMSCSNLAICVGPSLLSPPEEDLLPLEAMLEATQKVKVLLEFLLENATDIFGEEMAGLSPPAPAQESPAPPQRGREEPKGIEEAQDDAVVECESGKAPPALPPTTPEHVAGSPGLPEGVQRFSEDRRFAGSTQEKEKRRQRKRKGTWEEESESRVVKRRRESGKAFAGGARRRPRKVQKVGKARC